MNNVTTAVPTAADQIAATEHPAATPETTAQGGTTATGEIMTAKTKHDLRGMADFYLTLAVASLKSCDSTACMRAASYFRFTLWPAIRQWVPVDQKHYQKLHKGLKGFLWCAAQVKMNRGADLCLVDDFVGDLARTTVTLLVLNNFVWGHLSDGAARSEIKTQCLSSFIGDAAARFVPQIHWRFSSAANFMRVTSPAIPADLNNAAAREPEEE